MQARTFFSFSPTPIRKQVTIVLILLFFLQLNSGGSGLKSNFATYTAANGLESSQVLKIAQSVNGKMLFIGLESVTIYDGIRFHRRPANFVPVVWRDYYLHRAADGRLIGNFDGHRFIDVEADKQLVFHRPASGKARIAAFCIGKKNELIYSDSSGLYRGLFYADEDSIAVDGFIHKSEAYSAVTLLTYDPAGDQYFGIDRQLGLFRIDSLDQLRAIAWPSGSTAKNYGRFLRHTDGFYVVHDNHYVSLIDTAKNIALATIRLPSGIDPRAMAGAANGDVWLASNNAGVFKISWDQPSGKLRLRQYTTQNGLCDNLVHDVFLDSGGVLWLATNTGVNKLSNESFEEFVFVSEPGSSAFPNVWLENEEGIFLLSDPFGVARLSLSEGSVNLRVLSKGTQLQEAIYAAHFASKDNVLWLFSDAGIYRQNPAFSENALQTYVHPHLQAPFWVSERLSSEKFLIGSERSIYLLSATRTELNVLDKIDLPENAYDVADFIAVPGQPGEFYCGGYQLFWRLRVDNNLTLLEDSIPPFAGSDFSIYALTADAHGNVFVGTANAGLYIYSDSKWHHYPMKNNGYFVTFYDLLAARSGAIWGASQRGLLKMHYSSDSGLQVNRYSVGDLAGDTDVNYSSLHETRGGEILFGLRNALAIHYPERVKAEVRQNDLQIDRISVNGQELEKHQIEALDHDFSNLTIAFFYPNYRNESRYDYRYRLAPPDSSFRQTTAPGIVTLTSLTPGEYDLHLQVVDRNNSRVLAGRLLKLTVLIPIHQNWWFVGLLLLGIFVFAYFAWRVRVKFLLKQRRVLQGSLRQKTEAILKKNEELEAANKELGEMQFARGEFLAIIAHDLNNPINAVVNMARIMQNHENNDIADLREDARVIETAGLHMQQLVKNLIDFNQLEANNLSPRKQVLPVQKLLREIKERYSLLARAKHISMEISTEVDAATAIYADPDSFVQICGNIITNAIKFSPRDTRIEINCSEEGDEVHISIADEGPGIPDVFKSSIFDKYYSGVGGGDTLRPGSGLGLAIVKELIELHEARIAVTDGPAGKGSVFHLYFRCYRAEEKH
jgi:signal transduction histidine kinase